MTLYGEEAIGTFLKQSRRVWLSARRMALGAMATSDDELDQAKLEATIRQLGEIDVLSVRDNYGEREYRRKTIATYTARHALLGG
jgi:hypothetical protein